MTLQEALVLHTRPWRETSLLVEFYTRDHGRLGALARGVRSEKSRLRGLLVPFQPLLISWGGRGELASLRHAEAASAAIPLSGKALVCGLYCNELLMHLLHRGDQQRGLWTRFIHTLTGLVQSDDPRRHLRLFERDLLDALGFGLQLDHEAESDVPLNPDRHYRYDPEAGPRPVALSQAGAIAGSHLINLREGHLQPEDLASARQLLAAAIAELLDGKPLHSRELLR